MIDLAEAITIQTETMLVILVWGEEQPQILEEPLQTQTSTEEANESISLNFSTINSIPILAENNSHTVVGTRQQRNQIRAALQSNIQTNLPARRDLHVPREQRTPTPVASSFYQYEIFYAFNFHAWKCS